MHDMVIKNIPANDTDSFNSFRDSAANRQMTDASWHPNAANTSEYQKFGQHFPYRGNFQPKKYIGHVQNATLMCINSRTF